MTSDDYWAHRAGASCPRCKCLLHAVPPDECECYCHETWRWWIGRLPSERQDVGKGEMLPVPRGFHPERSQ